MGAILEVLTGRVTNPAALTALTVNTNDTFAVRAFGEGAIPMLEGMWTQQATAGLFRIRSPRMHDNAHGIRKVANAANPVNLLGMMEEQRLYQTDTLTVELQGGGAEVDAGAFMVYYGGVPAGFARLAMWEQVKANIRNLLTVQVDVAGPTTSGDWSAGTVITNLVNELHADTWYAVLGYELDTASLAVALQGPDTGNYRVGGPGALDPTETRDWFVRLAMAHQTPHIPLLNSQNRGATRAFVARVGAGGTINVSFQLAELATAL